MVRFNGGLSGSVPYKNVQKPRPAGNLRKYKKKQIPKNKVIFEFEIKSKIHSFNCLSCFYSYLELQNNFIFRNLFLFIKMCSNTIA